MSEFIDEILHDNNMNGNEFVVKRFDDYFSGLSTSFDEFPKQRGKVLITTYQGDDHSRETAMLTVTVGDNTLFSVRSDRDQWGVYHTFNDHLARDDEANGAVTTAHEDGTDSPLLALAEALVRLSHLVEINRGQMKQIEDEIDEQKRADKDMKDNEKGRK